MVKINEKQKEAIESGNEPLMIIAGAGSGKTFVLTQRIIYLVNKLGFYHNSILAFTFTNKAANEIRERILNSIPDLPFNWIGTFHSICLKILREDIQILNRSNNFVILDEEDQLSIIKEIYKIKAFSKDIIIQKKTLYYVSYLKSKKINIEDDEEIIKALTKLELNSEKIEIIRICYKDYSNYLLIKNLLDFDDLIVCVNKIFSISEEVKLKWQNRFNYILVDEFQDTNEDQFELLNHLIRDKQNVFIVGDPDQMIYSWRGAYSNIFEDFQDMYPNNKKILLEKNYRSSQNILDVSNQLIKNNKFRIEKALYTDNNRGSNITYYHASSSDRESNWIANKINYLREEEGYKYKDIAVLYRSNYLSRNIEQSLIYKEIPYVIFGGLKFFQRKEIKDLISFMKLICFEDDVSLNRIHNTPKRKISEAIYSKILQFANQNNISTWEGFKRVYEISELKDGAKKNCYEFYELILSLKEFNFITINDLVDKILKDTNYLEYLKDLDEEYRIENINELKSSIALYQYRNPKAKLNDYLQEITLYMSNEEKGFEDKRDYVSLMTIHNAKGLEFKNVFLMAFCEGLFPSSKATEKGDISEERRIAYVAMTRAKKNLFISSYDGKSFHIASASNLLPSRFIEEIKSNKNFETIIDSAVKYEKNYKSFSINVKNSQEKDLFENYHENRQIFELGDPVIHTMFGSGIVVGIDGDTLKITFKSPHGIKFISRDHKSIKKLLS
ncbi:MAG: ATP-dependent helicase [Mycoplasmoidaceae bacterium]